MEKNLISRAGIAWFVGITLLLVILAIHRESWFLGALAAVQSMEKRHHALLLEKQEALHALQRARSHDALRKEALQEGRVPLTLRTIQDVP